MTTALGIPSPAAVEVIRIVLLVGVVAGNTVMAISIIFAHVLIWDNLLTTSSVFQALTWIFQIMPLFFFAGAAACLSSWRPGTYWGGWLMKRTRLFRPRVLLPRVLGSRTDRAVLASAPTHLRSGGRCQHPAAVVLGAYVLAIVAAPAITPLGTAAARLVVDRARQLRGDDPLPVAHAGAAGAAPVLRLRRAPALPGRLDFLPSVSCKCF